MTLWLQQGPTHLSWGQADLVPEGRQLGQQGSVWVPGNQRCRGQEEAGRVRQHVPAQAQCGAGEKQQRQGVHMEVGVGSGSTAMEGQCLAQHVGSGPREGAEKEAEQTAWEGRKAGTDPQRVQRDLDGEEPGLERVARMDEPPTPPNAKVSGGGRACEKASN
ncbi:UNVERIFIED_CONTAM: hypothetical protein K2H54_022585 [Gekko kuhli]